MALHTSVRCGGPDKSSKKSRRLRLPHSAPFIAFGAIWAVYALIFPFYKLWHMIPAAIAAAIAALICSGFTKEPAGGSTGGGQRAPEAYVQDQAAELDRLAERLEYIAGSIEDKYVSDYAFSICDTIEKISDNIEANPIDSKKSRTFTKHYVPTVISIFERYSKLEKQGISGGNIGSSKAEIVESLDRIEATFKKQLDDMFDDDAMDIKTDLDTLSAIMNDIK